MTSAAISSEYFAEFEGDPAGPGTSNLGLKHGARVLLVGDSHTEGSFGVELENLLATTGASVVRKAKIVSI